MSKRRNADQPELMSDLQRSMNHLLDATGTVWELREQSEDEVRTLRHQIAALQRSYAELQRENTWLRESLQDILAIDGIAENPGIRLIAELGLHSRRS